jgi:hypothetical protein
MRGSQSRGAAAAIRTIVLTVLLAGVAGGAHPEPVVAVGSGQFGNVFQEGEPADLTIRVTADPDHDLTGRVHVAAHDAYGVSAGRLTFRVHLRAGDSAVRVFRLRYRHIGHLTLAVKLERSDGRRLARADTTAAIVPAVDESAPAEASGVGYFVLPFDSELPMADGIAEEMRRLGIRWARLSYGWWNDDRPNRPDTDDPSWLDSSSFERWVDAYRAHGIEVLGVLFGTARWASSAPDDETDEAGIARWGVVPPSDLADWQLLVRTMAERLQGRVTNWEVWNEPDITLFWQGTPQDFTQLARVTGDALRTVDPQVRVVLNLVDRVTPYGLGFRDVLLGSDADVFDVFGYHYGGADSVAAARAIQPILRPNGAPWNTEAFGAPRRHISRWLEQRTLGMERIFPFIYHTIFDDSAFPQAQRFGVYPVNLDYTPRPDGVAYRTMSDQVGSGVPIDGGPVGLGYSAYTFATAAGPTVALTDLDDIGKTWSGPPGIILRLRVPAAVRRVEVVDLMGNRTLQRVRGGRLRLRLLGVATFLHAEPAGSLTEVRVTRAHRVRQQ